MPDQLQQGLVRKSPLARFWRNNGHACSLAENVRIYELPHQGAIKLQCRTASPAFIAAVKDALDLVLPQAPNTRTGDAVSALWLAPNEWLIVTPPGKDESLAQRLVVHLGARLPRENTAVTLITDSQVALKIEGVAAADLIAKGCGLDLHPEHFPVGRCATSLLEQVPMVIYPQGDSIAYRLFIERSHAAFVWEWLCHAAKEFEFYP